MVLVEAAVWGFAVAVEDIGLLDPVEFNEADAGFELFRELEVSEHADLLLLEGGF